MTCFPEPDHMRTPRTNPPVLLYQYALLRIKVFIAPQAQLEESANDRSKPEVLISRVLKRDPLLDLGTPFERFCDWYLTFSCPKPGPGPHRIGPEIVCD